MLRLSISWIYPKSFLLRFSLGFLKSTSIPLCPHSKNGAMHGNLSCRKHSSVELDDSKSFLIQKFFDAMWSMASHMSWLLQLDFLPHSKPNPSHQCWVSQQNSSNNTYVLYLCIYCPLNASQFYSAFQELTLLPRFRAIGMILWRHFQWLLLTVTKVFTKYFFT